MDYFYYYFYYDYYLMEFCFTKGFLDQFCQQNIQSTARDVLRLSNNFNFPKN